MALGNDVINFVIQSIDYVGFLELGFARLQVQLAVESPSTNRNKNVRIPSKAGFSWAIIVEKAGDGCQ